MENIFGRFTLCFIVLQLCFFSCFFSCSNIVGDGSKSSEGDILSFSVPWQVGETTIDPRDCVITVTAGDELNLAQVKPLIEISPGAQISPASGEERDFSLGPVPYFVTAKNGSKQVWEVVVKTRPVMGTEIREFAFYTASNDRLITDIKGTINEESHTITVKLPYDSPVTGLVPSFVVTGEWVRVKGEIQQSAETVVDFDEPVTYRVIAGNNKTQDYIVTVTNGCACPERIRKGNYTIRTQEDISAFAGYTSITGNIAVDGNYSNKITSFEKLKCLTSIGGCLEVRHTNGLVTLEGFNNLVSIGVELLVDGNAALESLEAFSGITFVKSLSVSGNPLLKNLDGFHNITTAAVSVNIADNNSLMNLEALSGMTSVGRLSVHRNRELKNLDGLHNITGSADMVNINDNDSLETLAGLRSLSTVGGDLSIIDNDALTSLAGLENLDTIGDDLSIMGNDFLSNLKGLSGLTTVTGSVAIRNTSLVSLQGMGNLESIGEYLTIEENSALTDTSGFNKLNSLEQYLYIYNNKTLQHFTGFENLIVLGGKLIIYGNAALETVEGLNNLVSIEKALQIASNPMLTDPGLAKLSFVETTFKITGNSELCTAVAEGLQKQVADAGGIGGAIDISGNKECP
ncbi:MAG: hypothetical protein GY754_14705 [bacterium]|nr:hypothetical protein [bacterium]